MIFKKKKDKSSLTRETKQLIYETYFETVYKVALYVTRDKSAAEEVTQEAFTKAFEKYYQLKDPTKLPAWMKSIALNTARDYYNKQKKVVPFEAEKLEYIQSKTHRVEHEETKEETLETLRDAIKKLPKDFQNVVILKYYYELDVTQIAIILDLPEGTVKSRLFRARDKLKNIIVKIEPTIERGASFE